MKSRDQITYFDFNDIDFSSFFLRGFLKNQTKFNFRFVVSHSTPSLLRDTSMDGEWRKILFSICLFKSQIAGEEYYFCIDTRDSSTPHRAMGYHIPLLKKVRYYFKVNYNPEAINNDPILHRFNDKIIPASPYFPLRTPRLLPFFPRIIPSRVMDWTVQKSRRRIRRLKSLVSLEEFRQLRHVKKDLDIFFVMKFPTQGHHYHLAETRSEIIKELRQCPKINAIAGLISNSDLPSKYNDLRINEQGQKTYLHNLSRARLAIYVRGFHDCISFKFGELLALGKPIVGQKIYNNIDMIYSNKHFQEQFCYEDPKEIVQKAVELLGQSKKLAMLGKANAEMFDTKFTPEAAVSDIIGRQLRDITGAHEISSTVAVA